MTKAEPNRIGPKKDCPCFTCEFLEPFVGLPPIHLDGVDGNCVGKGEPPIPVFDVLWCGAYKKNET